MRQMLMIFFALVLAREGMAQEGLTNLGLFPELQFRVKSGEKRQFTGKIESQHGLASIPEGRDAAWRYRHVLTDFQGFVGTSINPFISLSAGYQFRLDGGNKDSHRAIQQISFLQRKPTFRLGHRIRTDQTFAPEEAIEYRLRYQFSAEIALEGRTVDPGEHYLVLADEVIYSYQGQQSGLENRFVAALGHLSKSRQKFQVGIDHRTDRFFDGAIRQRIWCKFGWYLTL
jgi:hypothetical protein